MISQFIKEVFVAQHEIDFRKGLSGLLAEAYAMNLDPYNGECVVFFHKSWRKIKIICGDEYGLCMVLRSFDGGQLQQKFKFMDAAGFVDITHAELLMLLEGAKYTIKSRPKLFRDKVA